MIAPSLTPRQKATNWAKRIVADGDVVFLDTETTGLGPDAEICDIAIIDRDGKILLNTLVMPLCRIPPEATAVHGITEKDVHRALMWHEAWVMVAAALKGKVLCAFNASFDVGMIRQVSAAAKRPDPVGAWQCATLAFADYLMVPSTKGPGFRWHSLGDACAALGVETNGFHRALSDAKACRLVVRAMAASSPVPFAPTAAKEIDQ